MDNEQLKKDLEEKLERIKHVAHDIFRNSLFYKRIHSMLDLSNNHGLLLTIQDCYELGVTAGVALSTSSAEIEDIEQIALGVIELQNENRERDEDA